MNRDEFYSSLYLAHHGIKGQKWGVRRYQNEDGSYTDEGAKRRRSDNKPGMSDGAKKALKIGAVAAGTALAAIGAYKLRQVVDIPYVTHFAVKKTGQVAKSISDKINSTKAASFAGRTIKDAGKSAASAAITAIGTIAASKIASQIKAKEGDSEAVKDVKLVGKEAAAAAIRSTARSASNSIYSNGSTNGSSNGGGFSSQTFASLTSEVGSPHQTHSWGEVDTMKRYNNLMDSYRGDDSIKQQIRMMKKGGFDIDQIEKKFAK